jgi:hypothetical protein
MVILLTATYRYDASPVRILMSFFTEIEKKINPKIFMEAFKYPK